VNILDSPNLKSGEQYGTYAHRLLGRASTAPLRLVEIWVNASRDLKKSPDFLQVLQPGKVDLLRRWPIITHVTPGEGGDILVTVEEGKGTCMYVLGPADQIMVEVA
jgi:hypothetical protein